MVRNRQELVARCCTTAENVGIRTGMPLTLARALMSDLHVVPWNPLQEFRQLYRLALWAKRISPLAGIERRLMEAARAGQLETLESSAWGLVLETTGTERVHRGEAQLAKRLYRALKRSGFDARIAIAPTIGVAWGLSRFAAHRITISHRLRLPEAFPLAALRIPHETVLGLAQIGVCTVGQLSAIPKQTLGARFGTSLLCRLDELQGAIPEPLHVITPRARFYATRTFDEGLTNRELLTQGLRMVLETLLGDIRSAHKHLLVCALQLRGRTEAGTRTVINKRLALHRGTADSTALMRLWETALEKLSLPARIEEIALEATQTETPPAHQLDVLEPGREDAEGSIAELLNTFAVLLGEEAVQQAELRESYVPEESFAYLPLQKSNSRMASANTSHVLLPERPPLLFPTPQPMRTFAMLPDRPPTWFEWRGKRHTVRHSRGPECVAAGWNNAGLALAEELDACQTREYFRLEDESGRWLWVFRERESFRWFVHGVWT